MASEEKTEKYSVEIPLQLYFSTDEPVAIKDITQSLLALEQLGKRFPEMLEKLTDVEINGYEIAVKRLEAGSLLEDLVFKVFFDDPEKLEKFKNFLENTKMGKAAAVGIGGVIALLLVSQLINAYQIAFGNDSPAIQANHNVIISYSSDALEVTPEKVQEIAEAGASGNRKKLFQAARNALRPVEGHENASVEVPGIDPRKFSYTSEAIEEVPFEADVNAAEQELDFENVLLEVRALDRDKAESGWWGVLPSVVGEKRFRIYFSDDVDIDAISYRPEAYVDATVTYRNDLNHAKLIPKHITINRIYPPRSG